MNTVQLRDQRKIQKTMKNWSENSHKNLVLYPTKGAFHLSELAGRTSQLANEMGFLQRVLLKNHLLHAYYLGFD